MNVPTTFSLQGSPRLTPPRLAYPIGRAVAGVCAHVVAQLASLMRPRAESPVEAAARLRTFAEQYSGEPSLAADLRAAADRHNNFGEGQKKARDAGLFLGAAGQAASRASILARVWTSASGR